MIVEFTDLLIMLVVAFMSGMITAFMLSMKAMVSGSKK